MKTPESSDEVATPHMSTKLRRSTLKWERIVISLYSYQALFKANTAQHEERFTWPVVFLLGERVKHAFNILSLSVLGPRDLFLP